MSLAPERPIALAILTLMFASACLAQPQTLRLGESLGPIAPHAIAGFNYGLSMPVVLHLDEFRALTLRSLRFPPGNDADDYPLTTDMMDAFEVQWQLLHRPDVLIVANYFEGPEHAVHALEYLRGIGVPVRTWAVGNEPDLHARNRMDPSWTAEVYCERFRAFASALREADPDVVLTGPAVSGSRPAGLEYLREVLGRCGDVIDVLTWHVYPTDGTWDDAAALATSDAVSDEIATLRSWLADPAVNPLGHERDIGLAITEFGLSWRTSNYRHLEDMTASLWLADALARMAVGGLDMSHYFALQSMGGHGLIDRGGWIRPTYYVFEMLADFSGEAITVDGVAPPLTAYAARSERGLRVLLVNRGNVDVEVVLDLERVTTLETVTLDEETYDETLTHRRGAHPGGDPLVVGARSIVLVRSAP